MERDLELQTLGSNLVTLQNQIEEFKVITEQYDALRKQLFEAMEKYGLNDVTIDNIKVTKVAPSTPKTTISMEFDLEKAKLDNPLFVNSHMKRVETVSKPKAGYVRISLLKEEV